MRRRVEFRPDFWKESGQSSSLNFHATRWELVGTNFLYSVIKTRRRYDIMTLKLGGRCYSHFVSVELWEEWWDIFSVYRLPIDSLTWSLPRRCCRKLKNHQAKLFPFFDPISVTSVCLCIIMKTWCSPQSAISDKLDQAGVYIKFMWWTTEFVS